MLSSLEPDGSCAKRLSRIGILSNSPIEHQREGEVAPCSRGGESSCGGDKIMQGMGMRQQGAHGRTLLRGR